MSSTEHEAKRAFAADVATLNEFVDRLSRSPAASVADKALLGRISASARLLGQPKQFKDKGPLMASQAIHPSGHLGRGCIND